MTRLYNFVRNECVTDITGNIYHYKAILSIISKLRCFGLTLEQLNIKKKFPSNILEIRKNYHKSKKDFDDIEQSIENKYEHVLIRYNELNDIKKYYIFDSIFEIKDHYTEEDIHYFKTQYEMFKEDDRKYDELHDIKCENNDNFDEAFYLNEELWKEIVFFKYIKMINKNKYLVEVVPFLYKKKLKSGLKIGDQITINPLDINYLNPLDKILKKYKDDDDIDLKIIPLNLPIVTDWNGRPYRNRDKATELLEEGNVVRIQFNMENKVSKQIYTYCWYIEIIKYDKNKEWFIGLSLSNYKIDHFNYDFKSEMKVDCLYYFHKNSILEIPLWENLPNYDKLEKEVIKTQKRHITGVIENDNNINIELDEVLCKFI